MKLAVKISWGILIALAVIEEILKVGGVAMFLTLLVGLTIIWAIEHEDKKTILRRKRK